MLYVAGEVSMAAVCRRAGADARDVCGMLIVDVARWQPWRRSGVYLVLLVAGDGCSLSKRCPAGTGDRQQ
jgi:hypothetical protein